MCRHSRDHLYGGVRTKGRTSRMLATQTILTRRVLACAPVHVISPLHTPSHNTIPIRHFFSKKKEEPPPELLTQPMKKDETVPTKQGSYSSRLKQQNVTPDNLAEKKSLPWFMPETLIKKQVKWDYLYEHCRDQAERFLSDLGIKDTFHTWFEATVLHLWMFFVRIRREPGSNTLAQNVFDSFWSEAEQRMYEYGSKNQLIFNKTAKLYGTIYHGSVIAYDEGLVGGDMILADALWRNLFQSGDVSAEKLVCAVKYIRRELQTLEKDNDLLMTGEIKWGDPIKPLHNYETLFPNNTNTKSESDTTSNKK